MQYLEGSRIVGAFHRSKSQLVVVMDARNVGDLVERCAASCQEYVHKQ